MDGHHLGARATVVTRPTLLPRVVEYEPRHDLDRRSKLVGLVPVADDVAAQAARDAMIEAMNVRRRLDAR
jgi:hypothetical protein